MSSRKSRIPLSKQKQETPDEPPAELPLTNYIARVVKVQGNALYRVELPSKSELLVELPMRFRNSAWVRRGGFVLVDTEGYMDGKVGGEIKEVIRDEKAWRKMTYWYIGLLRLLTLGPRNLREIKMKKARSSLMKAKITKI